MTKLMVRRRGSSRLRAFAAGITTVAAVVTGSPLELDATQDPVSQTADVERGQSAGEAAASRVDIVETVGCVEPRDGDAWWLVRSTDPTVSRAGVFNSVQVAAAREVPLGSREIELVGVADFLDADGLLRSAARATFTTSEQANATGALRPGRTVLVKGLLIENDGHARINLLAVVPLSEGDDCAPKP